jgi:hypothetical protein
MYTNLFIRMGFVEIGSEAMKNPNFKTLYVFDGPR